MIVLDTSAVSAVMQRLEIGLEHLARHDAADLVVCAPVHAEISFGLQRLPERSRRRALLAVEYSRLRDVAAWADWDEAAAHRFGVLKAELERAGTPIQDFDVAIASIALTRGAAVATLNTRHFEEIDGLEVRDWSV